MGGSWKQTMDSPKHQRLTWTEPLQRWPLKPGASFSSSPFELSELGFVWKHVHTIVPIRLRPVFHPWLTRPPSILSSKMNSCARTRPAFIEPGSI